MKKIKITFEIEIEGFRALQKLTKEQKYDNGWKALLENYFVGIMDMNMMNEIEKGIGHQDFDMKETKFTIS